MKRLSVFFTAILLFITCIAGFNANKVFADSDIYIKVEPQKYKVRIQATLSSSKNAFVVYFPLPQSNAFQLIEKIDHSPGEAYELPDMPGEMLLRMDFPQGLPTNSILFSEFYATLWATKVDFSKINEIYPYDTASELYKQYTRAEMPYLDPDNEHVREIVAELETQAANDLEFARLAFDYVIANMEQTYGSYKYDLPLAETMRKKKGVYLGLSNALISILRAKGIPARHVVGTAVSGDMELRQEFYLEKYGWIPMSITARPQYFDSKCFFGMATAPPSWFNRMPYVIILGHTLVGDELPGVDGGKTIANYRSTAAIRTTGSIPSEFKLLIEKVDE